MPNRRQHLLSRKAVALAGLLLLTGFMAGMGCTKNSSPTNSGGDGPPGPPKTWHVSTPGTSFSPAQLRIYTGDTVMWTSSGGHTVTSGTGASDPNVGSMFDHPLPSGQTFQWVFIKSGTINYFCRPHELMGMKGTITVLVRPQ